MKSLSPFVSTILMIALIIGTGAIVYSFFTGVQAENIGKDFTATIFLSNGTTITKTFSLDNPLGITNTLAKVNLTIEGYYPSYGLIDKMIVCSNSCPYICSELSSTEC